MIKKIITISLLSLLIGSCQNEDIATTQENNLSSKTVTGTVPSHDPSTIVKSGVNYYVFTTGDNIPMTYSTNLASWSWGTSVFSTTPSWITNYVSGFTKLFGRQM